MKKNKTVAETMTFLPQLEDQDLPLGYRFASTRLGIRADRDDCALIVCDAEAVVAAMFTRNAVKAAPVLAGIQMRAAGCAARAIVINSGNANACTGAAGMASVQESQTAVAHLLGVPLKTIWPMSTGVIGRPLVAGIFAGVKDLRPASGTTALVAAARAIMTTDTQPKVAVRTVKLLKGAVRVVGIAKGAGMIHPSMATMLAWIGTDAVLSQPQADAILQRAVEGSFNCISVDGDQSTNDTILFTANSASGVKAEGSDVALLARAATEVALDLARLMVLDGEGAAHGIDLQIQGARSESIARIIARAIANSNLVKTAIFGHDPNWGRIAAAAGAADPDLDPDRLTISIGGVTVFSSGIPAGAEVLAKVSAAMRAPWVAIRIELGQGTGASRFWASDMTYEYIRINAEYTT